MKRLVATMLVGGLLMAACGTAGSDRRSAPGGSGNASSSSASASADPEQPVSSTPDPDASLPQGQGRAQRVRPRPGMADLRRVAWEKARQTSSGRSLRVTYWSGVEPCNVLDNVDVRYKKSEIIVTLFEGYDPDQADVACIEIALLKAVVVPLEEPVEGRKLVDGAK